LTLTLTVLASKSWPRLLLILALVGLTILFAACQAAGEESVRLPQNDLGLVTAPELESYYLENGAAAVFGLPRSQFYPDPETGREVQYFDRLRLEFDRANGEIVVTALGKWASPQPDDQILAQVPESEDALFFPESGLTVQDEFLAFYEAHGGEALFGPPITPQLDEAGRRVQYFQNARLEWHPEATLALRIRVSPLGAAHYLAEGRFTDPGRARPLESAIIERALVSASVRSPTLFSGDRQVVYVTVTRPDDTRPVEGAVATLILTNGNSKPMPMPPTDASGHTKLELPLKDIKPGHDVQVFISVESSIAKQIGEATVSFKTWW
jgi:hypothetical protein